MTIKENSVETELRRSLDNGEIIPYFQPIVHIRTGILAGFEVLSRWRHPTMGMVPPHEFIPLLEQSGLIGRLTDIAMARAFAVPVALDRPLKLSVNISSSQLHDKCLPEQIQLAAERAGFPLDHLTIEITESALIDDLERSCSVATELKRLGIRLSLDDFGTGYSSLHHLRALPFDELKLDRSYVATMISSRDSRKIVAAVIGLGQSLDLTTVAEGIEASEQADMLLWLGCELGQGWLYGPAVSAEDVPTLLSTPFPASEGSYADSLASASITCLQQPPSLRLAQHNAIYDGAPVGLCFLDSGLRHISINKRLAEMNGIPVNAHLGRTVAELVDPSVYSQIEPYLLRALKGEAITGIEIQIPSLVEGKGFVTQLCCYQPAVDEAGEVIGVSVAAVDISERKQAEEALRASEDRYRQMVHLNPQLPWIMDADGLNVEVCPQWGDLTGQTGEQAFGSGWRATLHPQDLMDLAPALEASLRTGDPIDVEYRVRTRDGNWRWMRARGQAQRNADGQIQRWYGSTEDIDDFMKIKHTLRESQATVDVLLKERLLATNGAVTARRMSPPGEDR